MTYDDDFVRLHLSLGTKNVALRALGLSWPPPEWIYLGDGGEVRSATDEDDLRFVLLRVSYSAITDEQRAGMTHVCRGAEYVYASEAVRRLTQPTAGEPSG